MSLSDDFIDALKALIENLEAYRDDLRQAGQTTEGDKVARAHGQLLQTFEQIDSAALQDDLSTLDDDATSKLRTITDQMATTTANLDRDEATVAWVVQLVGGIVAFVAAPGGGTLAGLWGIWGAKPS